ncbi:hypothetical protein ABEV34_10980 [Methylorubrum rhodesianum]|jgi:hypothetical protein|uniref:Secreted protein n=1 Tax=Methylorubrum rhodesianum TaxID=29427 RepID=A0ABU9ZEH3_9HYPH|nr:hypothetical protein [Methylorubrum rhodesianum]MBB5760980.1 hypothetical protein [Methylorubrum rhodesianum]MBI1687803.1 hypothetical protein [Methylorubrum sp. DB1722]MBK3405842.1 hypothetical protein [Methylorubrum rhodesianum]MBY0140659.1 hypothetical protein [Methylorubrum populi]
MKTIIALLMSAALLWTSGADAQANKPPRQPTAASTQALCEQPPPEVRAHVSGEAERAQAQARMEALYKRLDDRADWATHSICKGCRPERPSADRSWQLVASAQESENIVGDPAQAPEY